MKKNLNIIFTLLFLALFQTTCIAQIEKDTLNVLFVGNSYTYYGNLPHIVSLLSDSTKIKLKTKKSTIGGAKLSDHWHGKRGLKTKNMIINENFDIVVLQEFSMGAIKEPDSLNKYIKLFCDLIKSKNAKPYLYQTWAREKVPQFQKTINKVYSEAASVNQATIVPVGEAWEKARQLRPDIELFKNDGSHPEELGVYLTACVFVNALTHEIPVDFRRFSIYDTEGESVKLILVDDNLDAVFCRKIASDTSIKD